MTAAGGVPVHADLTQMARQLKDVDGRFAAGVRRQVRAAVSESGSVMLSEVRLNASWSSRIPGATSVKTSFSTRSAKVQVVVNAKQAPHARALELGNKTTFSEAEVSKRTVMVKVGGRSIQAGRRKAMAEMKKSGTGVGRALRHPVFDSKHPPTRVGEQPTRPFFFPAAAANAPATQRRMEDALDKIARDAGFK